MQTVMQPNWGIHRPAILKVLKWAGLSLAAVLGLVLLALVLLDGERLKGPIERMASAKSGRDVSIAGTLAIHPWSWTPSAVAERLTVANPAWETQQPAMLQVERVTVRMKWLPLLKGDVVLAQVILDQPKIYLHRERSGRANWSSANIPPSDARAPQPPNFPVVRDFIVRDGNVRIVDDMRRLDVAAAVQAHEQASRENPRPFRIDGRGKLNDEPFEVHVAGGPLINLDPGDPYPFDFALQAGKSHVTATGTFPKPFDLSRLRLHLEASGDDLADYYYLTQLALPNTRPFKVAANVNREGHRIEVGDIAGHMGSSDIRGNLAVDVARERPFVSGALASNRLRLSDLVASLGAETGGPGTLQPKPSTLRAKQRAAEHAAAVKQGTEPPAGVPRLFPDAKLQVDRVRGMDADVKFEAHAVEAGKVPMKDVSFHVKLDSGVLSIDPFALHMPQGQLSGVAHIDARGQVAKSQVDLRIRSVELDQLKGKAPDAQAPLAGVVEGRAKLEGTGNSVHEFAASADGSMTVVLPSGEMRSAFAELTGINVARGLGLLLSKDEDRTEIRCGVADFDVLDGTAHARRIVLDTHNMLVKGSGEIRLAPEELDLSIKGKPKKLRFLRVRSPIQIEGHLRAPTFGLKASNTLRQGAIAAAVGVVVAPFAAIAAFVDPGLAKDAKCSQLLASE